MTETLPDVRRVVTGHDASGRSIITEDGAPPRVLRVDERPGYAVTNVWHTVQAPADVHAPDTIADHTGVMPPKGGTVIRVIDMPPESADPAELARQMKATFQKLYPDAAHNSDSTAHQGMHETLTVDYAIVLKGSITAIMDTEETILNAGDILIQRGTNHAWANRGSETCRIAFVLIDGKDHS